MRIAFHTPGIDSSTLEPGGAVAVAASLRQALTALGHEVVPVDRCADREEGERRAAGMARTADAPGLWLTYGGASAEPDWLGPPACAALGIPLLLVEPSGAGPDAGSGPADTVVAADAVIALSDACAAWAEPHCTAPERLTRMLPFIDIVPIEAALRLRDDHRRKLATRLGLSMESPWLLTVGAMRPGDRLDSYRALARAFSRLVLLDWQLLIVGDGPARAEVEAAFRALPPGRVHLLGRVDPDALIPVYVAADLYVSAAMGGTRGMALLTAQAAGLPVVVGDAAGVREVVRDGLTGRIAAAGNPESLANALGFLLRHPEFRLTHAKAAPDIVARDHQLALGAAALGEVIDRLVPSRP